MKYLRPLPPSVWVKAASPLDSATSTNLSGAEGCPGGAGDAPEPFGGFWEGHPISVTASKISREDADSRKTNDDRANIMEPV
jgi:hypothetical protein